MNIGGSQTSWKANNSQNEINQVQNDQMESDIAAKYKKVIEYLNEQLAVMKQKQKVYDKSAQEQAKVEEDLIKTKIQLKRSEDQVNDLKKEIAQLQHPKEVSYLKAELDKMNSYVKENNPQQLKEAIAYLNSIQTESKKEINDLRLENLKLQDEIKQFQQENNKLMMDNNMLNQKIDGYIKQISELQTLQIPKLSKEIIYLSELYYLFFLKLKSQVKDKNSQFNKLNEQIALKNQENNDLQSTIEALKKGNAEQGQLLDKFDKEVTFLKEQNKIMEAKNIELEKYLEKFKAEVLFLNQQNNSLTNSNNKLNLKTNNAAQQIQQQSSEISLLKKESRILENTCEGQKKTILEQKTQNEQIVGQLKILTQKNQNYQKFISSMETEKITQNQLIVKKHQREIQELTTQWEQALLKSTSSLGKYNNQIDLMNQENKELKERNSALIRQLGESEHQLQALQLQFGKFGIEIKETREKSSMITNANESKMQAMTEKYKSDVAFLQSALNEEQLARKRAQQLNDNNALVIGQLSEEIQRLLQLKEQQQNQIGYLVNSQKPNSFTTQFIQK